MRILSALSVEGYHTAFKGVATMSTGFKISDLKTVIILDLMAIVIRK